MITTIDSNTTKYIGSKFGFKIWYKSVNIPIVHHYLDDNNLLATYYNCVNRHETYTTIVGSHDQYERYTAIAETDCIMHYNTKHQLMNVWCDPKYKLTITTSAPKIVIQRYCRVTIKNCVIPNVVIHNVTDVKCLGVGIKHLKIKGIVRMVNCRDNKIKTLNLPTTLTIDCRGNHLHSIYAPDASYIHYDFHYGGKIIRLDTRLDCEVRDHLDELIEVKPFARNIFGRLAIVCVCALIIGIIIFFAGWILLTLYIKFY